MNTLALEECEEGMVVILSNPDPSYSIGQSNPALGTVYECVGEIVDVDIESEEVFVGWQNGCDNVYTGGELSLHGQDNQVKVESIWNF